MSSGFPLWVQLQEPRSTVLQSFLLYPLSASSVEKPQVQVSRAGLITLLTSAPSLSVCFYQSSKRMDLAVFMYHLYFKEEERESETIGCFSFYYLFISWQQMMDSHKIITEWNVAFGIGATWASI